MKHIQAIIIINLLILLACEGSSNTGTHKTTIKQLGMTSAPNPDVRNSESPVAGTSTYLSTPVCMKTAHRDSVAHCWANFLQLTFDGQVGTYRLFLGVSEERALAFKLPGENEALQGTFSLDEPLVENGPKVKIRLLAKASNANPGSTNEWPESGEITGIIGKFYDREMEQEVARQTPKPFYSETGYRSLYLDLPYALMKPGTPWDGNSWIEQAK